MYKIRPYWDQNFNPIGRHVVNGKVGQAVDCFSYPVENGDHAEFYCLIDLQTIYPDVDFGAPDAQLTSHFSGSDDEGKDVFIESGYYLRESSFLKQYLYPTKQK